MEFVDGLLQLIFSPDGTYKGSGFYPLLIFSVASGIMGCFIVLLDWLTFQSNRGSALKLIYRGGNVLWLILLWGAGAGLGGFIGASFGVLELNRAACITIGIGWPFILPRIIKSVEAEDEDFEDYQEESV